MHPAIAAATRQGIRVVRETMEFRRVHGLPRRTHVELQTDLLHEILRLPLKGCCAQVPRTCDCIAELLPAQTWALQEARVLRGLAGPLECSAGKTGVAFLIPTMVEAQRPLVLVPGGVLKKKTLQVDLPKWRKNFRVHDDIRFMSYEKLARENAADFLETYQPDHVIADEAQKLKNSDSAAHRRLGRYFEGHPEARFYPLSGTLMTRSLRQGYILLWWALRERSPLPHSWMEIQDWADVIDEKIAFDVDQRPMPGALLKFCNPSETLRQGFERRLQESLGYVFTYAPSVLTSLRVSQADVKVPPVVEEAFKTLRGWKTPDGEVIMTAMDLARHAKELISGFYYRWVWAPDFPEAAKRKWLWARKLYRQWVRSIIKRERVNGRHFDTEMQVVNARKSGFLDSMWLDEVSGKELDVYELWLEIRDTADPQTEPVWVSEYMLDYVEKWLKTPKSIAWVEHTAFLERMRERGVLCFAGGEDGIVDEAMKEEPRPCVLSIAAHGTGKNLQGYCRNLFLAVPGSGEVVEQTISRTHRKGQEADEVECFFVLACKEMWKLFQSAMQDARNVHRDGQGQRQKLIFADVSIETEDEIDKKTGPLWVQSKPPDEGQKQ